MYLSRYDVGKRDTMPVRGSVIEIDSARSPA
ncbi:hypothetical protein NSPZN2_30527 [Nitrospira defluvii]|uniref:Uncharacterized protein n=1 Tax=Nitrospira defluvii TaxID=330214 RepID=A0ABM8RKR8_9BACT|nr:hypothetical protein NSPZN2_30527 [Nitrospira defluvii]